MTETEFEVRRAITFIEKFTIGQIADMANLDHKIVEPVIQELSREGFIVRTAPHHVNRRGRSRKTYILVDEMRGRLYASVEAFQLEQDLQGMPIERRPT